MISLSAITFDMSGHVEFEPLPSSDFGNVIRRYSKAQTLDGGVVANDYGFTHADRVFNIRLTPTEEQDEIFRYLVENHAQVHVSTSEGVFSAILEYNINRGEADLRLSITEKLT